MKVFLSWSGTTSHKVAVILRDWLPSVIQSIQPYVSSEDIDKGARWSTDIAGELDASTYGVICLTPENVGAPWINFEAGALGKSVEKSRVSPVLFRLKKSEVHGPLVQFQLTVIEKDDVLKLLQSINNTCGDEALEPQRLAKAFDVWWPDLERQLNGIPEEKPSTPAPTKKAPAEIGSMLEELIDLTRANHKLLRESPAQPQNPYDSNHFNWIFDENMRMTAHSEELSSIMRELNGFIAAKHEELNQVPAFSTVHELIRQLEMGISFLHRSNKKVRTKTILRSTFKN